MKSHIKLTKKIVLKTANDYSGSNFSTEFSKEYYHARRHKYGKELQKVLDINRTLPIRKIDIYTIERIKKETLKIAEDYAGTHFSIDFPKEYNHANHHCYTYEIKKILKKNKFKKHDVLYIAKNYEGNNFQKDFSKMYNDACRNNYVYELNHILGIDTKELLLKKDISEIEKRKTEVLNLAKLYKGTSFSKDFPLEYRHASYHQYARSELKEILDKQKIRNYKPFYDSIKCDCGHTRKDHYKGDGYCHKGRYKDAGNCECTYFHQTLIK